MKMPLHGKIVVIKRSGGDGTEFPLTATCLFGRKPDCDIRIQLPQVSKEHCRIDLNENKQVILTNLSSVNPTLVNGEVLQQSERLKHGDVITIIDRSFRFEYPPAPTPKKRSSTGGKVLQDQQVGDTVAVVTDEKRISEVSTDPHLKDGANHDNIQRSLEKTVEMESKKDSSLLQNKTISPFSDLYQMIKKSLDVNTPRKSSASLLQTPASRFCTPKPGSVRKNVGKPVITTEDKGTPKKDEITVFSGAEESKGQADSLSIGTPKSVKKQRKSFQLPPTEVAGSAAEESENSTKCEATSPQKRNRSPPQRFTACEVIEHISAQAPKSPVRRRSKEATPAKPAVTKEQEEQATTTSKTEPLQKASPRNSGKVEKVTSKKRKSGELAADLPKQQTKRKRVSFGGYLSPELFDKRLPPDSPLRKGATPRRSLCLAKPKQSLLRRASVIGYLKEFKRNDSGVGKKSPKLKTASPAKRSPKSKTPSPKAASPAKKSPKSKTPSPKAASPAKKSPKSKTPSPKAASPAKRSPKSKTPSPKAASPAKKLPKSKTPSPKAASPGKKSPKSTTPSPKTQRKSATTSQVACKETPTASRRSSMVVSTPATQKSIPPVGVTPAKTPLSSRVQTPTVQGRFSVSRISTPSPVPEDAVSDQLPSIAVTPKIPLRRTSMKSTSRKTPKVTKSTVKVIRRRSGISRASMKVINSWADIVKFGQTKTQVAAPAKKVVTKKTMKKNVSKQQTPARKLKGYVSTGHADSPVTIVVGRAYKQRVGHPTGAAPRMVTNIALFRKDMKMDEDLTGISEMFKTPVNEKKRRSKNGDNATKTPVGSLSLSVVEPSVLTTPEEPGEMMVSPLSVASTVQGRRYNSEAVKRLLNADQETSFVSDVPALEIHSDASEQQSTALKITAVTTPKQKPEAAECLTGVKRIMKTPRQKAEPVEDIRGKLLVTPKQKAEQQECLTGVKRIMKTPRQKAEPIEDIRGKLLVTPKQKAEQQECLTGVKRIMKTPREKGKPVEDKFGIKRLMKSPRLRGNSPVEDFEGLQELMKEPLADFTEQMETNEVEDQTLLDCGVNKAEELFDTDTVRKEPHDTVLSHDNVAQVGMAKETEADEVGDNHTEEVSSGHSSDAMESISLAAVNGDLPVEEPNMDTVKHLSEEQPKVEIVVAKVTEIKTTGTDHEKKSLRGRRARVVESKAAEDKQEVPENSKDAVVPAPVRGRRGKKTEPTAPPAVRQTTRNRSKDVELTIEESAPQPSKGARPKRGRNAKKGSEDQDEIQVVATETEAVPEDDGEQCLPGNFNHKTTDGTESLEKAAAKPRRGRKTKQESEQSQTTLEQDVPQADMAEDANAVCHDQLDVVSSGSYENKLIEATETAPQAPVTELLAQVETATCNEVDEALVQKKSVRGRRAKTVESKVAENEQSEDPAIPTPVRGRRGKKTEATAPPAVRQTTRNRNAKSQESISNQPEVMQETTVTETSSEAIIINTSQEESDSAPPAEEAVVKPIKGRKTKIPVKPPQAKPEKNEVIDQHLVADAQPQQPIDAVEKPRRGRKAQLGTTEPKDVPEEFKQQMQPVGRAKRGRDAKQEEKPENDGKRSSIETTKTEEPVTKSRKTRRAQQDLIEPREEIQTAKAPVVAEPVKTNGQSAVAAKPGRGGRKPKPGIESETPVKSTEVQEVPAASSTDKPKRGTRGKRVMEEVEVTAEVPERKPEHELKTAEPVIKSSRARVVKSEVSQTIPAKRARRGAALPLEENSAESVVLISESASVEPNKRGRRAAAKPTTDTATVSSDQANPSEELSSAVVEGTKSSKRSVKWKTDLEVFEIPKATPVKAVRGRKSKAGDQAEAESKHVSKDVNKTEEKDLSVKTVEVQPVKRARRGAKVADDAELSSKVDPKKDAEAETQPKTRRGRVAKK